MKIYLIRHAMTKGNLEKRYIGRTDEELCEAGISHLEEYCKNSYYPQVARVFVSPMKRCIQSAEIIYPKNKFTIIDELAECDFGIFENKNYKELSGVSEYQRWVDSGGTLPFPEGESRERFSERSLSGFEKAISMCRKEDEKVAFVVHGGTIMSIMEKYAIPKGNYYDFQIGNGEGYELILSDDGSFDDRIFVRSYTGRPTMDVSSGADDRKSDFGDRKNYQRLFAENKAE